ncbi:hypothetical protein NDU88_003330 [Pleurodeles waltl]|uniref:Uncharacterized protein n=1 Tax=Pleurodeles waltl TaxID=8319 RepID=A0AAV7UEV1_PLEWA|nr:hypothetical protein NDU88_003330 [Pleurodeles waltl]
MAPSWQLVFAGQIYGAVCCADWYVGMRCKRQAIHSQVGCLTPRWWALAQSSGAPQFSRVLAAVFLLCPELWSERSGKWELRPPGDHPRLPQWPVTDAGYGPFADR